MPNNVLKPWVKNVNNLRIPRCKTSDKHSTTKPKQPTLTTPNCAQPTNSALFQHQISTALSTVKLPIPNLLFATFTHYPHRLLMSQPN